MLRKHGIETMRELPKPYHCAGRQRTMRCAVVTEKLHANFMKSAINTWSRQGLMKLQKSSMSTYMVFTRKKQSSIWREFFSSTHARASV